MSELRHRHGGPACVPRRAFSVACWTAQRASWTGRPLIVDRAARRTCALASVTFSGQNLPKLRNTLVPATLVFLMKMNLYSGLNMTVQRPALGGAAPSGSAPAAPSGPPSV